MLKYWVDFFEDLQTVRGRSQNTVMAYRRDLELYEEFLQLNKSIDHFNAFMQNKNLSARSQARVISSLRTYLKFCQTKGEKVPELRILRQPKVKLKLPRPITTEEFNSLLDVAHGRDEGQSFRNRLTLFMLLGLGCRVSELVDLNLASFNATESWVCVLGKGGKERLVPVTDGLREKMLFYLEKVRPELVKKTAVPEAEALLINDRGHRPSRVDIWRWLAQWSERAGFATSVSPHQFRHGCATALLESGADLRSIQLLLGHSNIQTTQVYTSVSDLQLKTTIDQHHPMAEDLS